MQRQAVDGARPDSATGALAGTLAAGKCRAPGFRAPKFHALGFHDQGISIMHLTFGTGIRIAVLSGALAILAACGSSGKPAESPSTTVAMVPDTAAATTAPAPGIGPKITITQTVWANYQDYLKKVGRIGDGYYFVTEDGQGGGSWACGNALCEGSFDGKGAAKQQCESSNPGKTCVLFSEDSRIQLDYEVAQ
jgi:hypothetical protein